MPALDDLTSAQRKLVDALWAENGEEIERQALLKVLIEPGNERAFLVRYFGESFSASLEDFHMRLIDTGLYVPRGLVLFPAGHGKTTLISGKIPILEVIRNPNVRIAIIAKNDNEATAIMASIKAELEQNELLIADYGPFRPADGDPMRAWKTEAISVAQRTRMGKEHTIAVFGAGSRQILGWRTDLVICDDVVTEKNSATPDQRQKHLDWFNLAVSTSPEKKRAGELNGRICVVGTMFHPHDLYNSIENKRKSNGDLMYKTHREDAIRDEKNQIPLWPEVWSWEDLMDVKRAEGTLSFNKRYRNKPVDESMQPFREEYFTGGDGIHPGCFKPDMVLGQCEPDWRIFQMLDPAVGKTKSAKFCGHIVFGIPPEDPKRKVLLSIERLQLTVPQQRDLIIQTHMDWGARAQMVMSVTELNAYQAGLNQIITERCDELGIVMRLEGHTTGVNKQDPEIGIPALARDFENGNFWLPTGNPESYRKSHMLAEEAIEYPFFAYSDLLMALWFGHLKVNTGIPIYKSTNRLQEKSRFRHPNRSKHMIRNPLFTSQTQSATALQSLGMDQDQTFRDDRHD